MNIVYIEGRYFREREREREERCGEAVASVGTEPRAVGGQNREGLRER